MNLTLKFMTVTVSLKLKQLFISSTKKHKFLNSSLNSRFLTHTQKYIKFWNCVNHAIGGIGADEDEAGMRVGWGHYGELEGGSVGGHG